MRRQLLLLKLLTAAVRFAVRVKTNFSVQFIWINYVIAMCIAEQHQTSSVVTMMLYVILRGSALCLHKANFKTVLISFAMTMISEAIAFNMTVDYQTHTQPVISVSSTLTLTVFSVTLTMLTNTEITVFLNDFHTATQQKVFPLKNSISRVCVWKDFSSHLNKTFICPFGTPRVSHNITVFGLRRDNINKVRLHNTKKSIED